jgi:chemotaxis protein MotB
MGKKCPPCDCKKGLPLWMGTFGDLMSLLLTFFVLLLSMATFDAKKLSEAEGSMRGTLGLLEGGSKTEDSRDRMQMAAPMEPVVESSDAVRKIKSLLIDYDEMTKVSRGPSALVEDGDEGFLIRLPARMFFTPGSIQIEHEEGYLFFKRMADIIKQLPSDMEIAIRGHTDTLPPEKNSVYRDNWEVSTYRALTVARELKHHGINPKNITALGYAGYRPIASNATQKGRLKNNRVDLYFNATQAIGNQEDTNLLDLIGKS